MGILTCNKCGEEITYSPECKCPNDILSECEGWWQNDEGQWFCSDHKMRTFIFTATSNIEAIDEEEAKEIFANNSEYFAASAEIEEVEL